MVRRKQPKHFKQSPPLLTDFSPPELWDSYRALYTRLLLPTQVKEQRAVAVAGVRPGAAHAVVCANLAAVASRSERVLLVDACLQTLGAARQRDSAVPLMSVQIAEGFPLREAAGFEPRLVQAGVVGLLRAACRANPADLVAVSLSAGTEAFILTVTGERPPAEAEALAVAEETARLHKGGLAVCSGTVGLSLSTSLPGDAGLYVAPTPTQLLRDTLSAVQVGLYSSLG